MAASINKTGTIEVSAHDIDDAIKEIGALKHRLLQNLS